MSYKYIMKVIVVLLMAMLTSCVSNLTQEKQKKEKYTARITYYSVGQDKWGDKVACPQTPMAKEGITIAAHPQFKFGTKVHIPQLENKIGDGYFIVQDRGGAVTKKKAAKGKAYVFDIFVKNQKLMWNHAYNRPMYMDVYVINTPNG